MTRQSLAPLVMTVLLGSACGHEGLSFDPESLAAAGTADGESGRAGAVAASNSVPWEPGRAAEGEPPVTAGEGGMPGSFASSGLPLGGAGDLAGAASTADDPGAGTKTRPDQWAPWCDGNRAERELCGSGLDEDCDGRVDEMPGLGAPCVATGVRDGCRGDTAILRCDAESGALVCVASGCENQQYDDQPCGDGFVDVGEECDPGAPGEALGQTCRSDCRRPLFERCVPQDEVGPCPWSHACSPWVGACMPVLDAQRPRCPDITIDARDRESGFYPMVEVEGQTPGETLCWISCTDGAQCPMSLSHCYQGFCVVDF